MRCCLLKIPFRYLTLLAIRLRDKLLYLRLEGEGFMLVRVLSDCVLLGQSGYSSFFHIAFCTLLFYLVDIYLAVILKLR